MRRPARLLASLVAILTALPLLLGAGPAPAADATAGLTADLVVAAAAPAAADLPGGAVTVGCREPLVLDPVFGCVRRLADGMLEYVAPDGSTGTTHGPDAPPADADVGHDHGGHEHEHEVAGSTTVDSSGSRALPSKRRPVACAPEGEARTVVLYGHRSGADRRRAHLGTIRETMERSNQAVAASAARSGGPLADLRVRCTSSGVVAVTSVAVASNRFADLRAAMAAAGYDQPHEKYLLFLDEAAADSRVAGTADLFLDDRRSLDNRNNGRTAMYAVVYGSRNFGGSVALHELGHTMGAVQPKAPQADPYGHCTDQLDVLCYPSNSSRCGSLAFDCGNDTYFSTATRSGQWLHHNWNLGWEGNRFITLTAATSTSKRGPGGFTDTAGHTHGAAIAAAVERGIASGYADGTFRPGRSVSRGQMATFLTRALKLPAGDPSRFSDVRGHAHARGVGAIVREQITTGYRDGTFRPDGVVTRGQMATFLVRALGLPPAKRHGFSDVRGSSHEASIAALAAAGITGGYSDGTFRPNHPVPRGQMAAFLIRALDQR